MSWKRVFPAVKQRAAAFCSCEVKKLLLTETWSSADGEAELWSAGLRKRRFRTSVLQVKLNPCHRSGHELMERYWQPAGLSSSSPWKLTRGELARWGRGAFVRVKTAEKEKSFEAVEAAGRPDEKRQKQAGRAGSDPGHVKDSTQNPDSEQLTARRKEKFRGSRLLLTSRSRAAPPLPPSPRPPLLPLLPRSEVFCRLGQTLQQPDADSKWNLRISEAPNPCAPPALRRWKLRTACLVLLPSRTVGYAVTLWLRVCLSAHGRSGKNGTFIDGGRVWLWDCQWKTSG